MPARSGKLWYSTATEGAQVASTPIVRLRTEPELIEEAAKHAGLAPGASVSQIIRYALAVVAGRPDPHAVAFIPRGGRKPREGAAA